MIFHHWGRQSNRRIVDDFPNLILHGISSSVWQVIRYEDVVRPGSCARRTSVDISNHLIFGSVKIDILIRQEHFLLPLDGIYSKVGLVRHAIRLSLLILEPLIFSVCCLFRTMFVILSCMVLSYRAYQNSLSYLCSSYCHHVQTFWLQISSVSHWFYAVSCIQWLVRLAIIVYNKHWQ